MYSDSGVVTRMCGGVFSIAAPLLRQRVTRAHRRPHLRTQIPALQRQLLNLAQRPLKILLHIVRQRLQRRNVNDMRLRHQPPSSAARNSLSMHTRNAASVLPDPVGAEISVGSPRRIARPSLQSCGSVGVPNRRDEPLLHQRMRPPQ